MGQKKLNGAASRVMVQFAAMLASEIHAEHPSDVHRSHIRIRLEIGCFRDWFEVLQGIVVGEPNCLLFEVIPFI